MPIVEEDLLPHQKNFLKMILDGNVRFGRLGNDEITISRYFAVNIIRKITKTFKISDRRTWQVVGDIVPAVEDGFDYFSRYIDQILEGSNHRLAFYLVNGGSLLNLRELIHADMRAKDLTATSNLILKVPAFFLGLSMDDVYAQVLEKFPGRIIDFTKQDCCIDIITMMIAMAGFGEFKLHITNENGEPLDLLQDYISFRKAMGS